MVCIKLKNIFGETWKQSYRDLKISARPTQTCGLAASPNHIAFPWDVGSGGVVALIDINYFGRNPPIIKLLGHAGSIQDLRFNEFDHNIIASASDDCTVKIWDIPASVTDVNKPRCNFTGHSMKVTNLSWNPAVDFVLLSGGFDCCAKVWDVSEEKEIFTYSLDDPLSCCNWTTNGDMVLLSTKEANVSLVDPRNGNRAFVFKAHDSNKLTHASWLGGPYGNDHLATTGFVNNKTRQIRIWDVRNLNEPLITKDIDSSSSPLIPHWDELTGLLSVVAKGDMTVRIFQYFEGELNRAGEFKTGASIKSFCLIPTSICDKTKCELGRFLTNENCAQINATSMFIIRRNTQASMIELYGDTPRKSRTTVHDWKNNILAEVISNIKLNSKDEGDKSDVASMLADLKRVIEDCNDKYNRKATNNELIGTLEKLKKDVTDLISSLK